MASIAAGRSRPPPSSSLPVLLPAAEDLNAMSFVFLVLALGIGVSILTNPNLKSLRDAWVGLRDLLVIGPFRSIANAAGLLNLTALSAGFVLWFVPLALGA